MGTDKDQQVLHSLCVASCGEGYGDINLYNLFMFHMNIEQLSRCPGIWFSVGSTKFHLRCNIKYKISLFYKKYMNIKMGEL